jgi:hypothetical protein
MCIRYISFLRLSCGGMVVISLDFKLSPQINERPTRRSLLLGTFGVEVFKQSNSDQLSCIPLSTP